MTLKERFEEIPMTVEDRNLKLKYLDEKMQCINKCNQIAEEFAIEFAKWVLDLKLWQIKIFIKNPTEKLLEMFKKEKGL